MKKLLFINCCIRKESRTEKLCRRYLDRLGDEYEISEVKLADLTLMPFDEQKVDARTSDIENGTLDKEDYQLAKQFAQADMIVIGAPYWDASFPSKLKLYIEHICVNSIAFAYGPQGEIIKLCHANHLVYITTAGGYIPKPSSVQLYMEELCVLFGIENMEFYCAEGLDIYPQETERILDETFQEMK